MPPVRFEPTISTGERPKTYALDRQTNSSNVSKCYNEKVITSAAQTFLNGVMDYDNIYDLVYVRPSVTNIIWA
jgi:hypothetical protein